MKNKLSHLFMLLSLCGFAQIPSYVPTNGLAAFYPFTGNANDISGNNNHGTQTGPVLTTDRYSNPNSAYYFDGVNDYISANLSTTLTTNWTISGWYKVDGGNAFNAYYSFGLGYTPNANGFGFGGTQHSCYPMKYGMYDGGNGSGCVPGQSLHGNVIPDYSQWNHMVLVNAANTYSFYFNGVYDNSATRVSMPVGNFVMGKRKDNQLYYKGTIDEVAIYNRVLTPQEITDLYTGSTSVSLQEQNAREAILVYPNPAGALLHVKFQKSDIHFSYRIKNTLGQTVLDGLVDSERFTLNTSSLSKGIYFLTIEGEKPVKFVIE